MRAGSGGSGWRRVVIAGISVGVGYATIGVVGLASGSTSPTPSVYSAVAPVTVLGRSLAAHSSTDVTVAGVGSVPSNATSVQLSVTALSGTTTSSMYVYATGDTQPTSANVRWTTGEVVTIPVTVAVGTSGKVRLTTDGGTVTIKVAVVGYFAPAPAPGGVGYVVQPSTDMAIASSGTVVASLDIPAGTYEVHATAEMFYEGDTGNDEVLCHLTSPENQTFGYSATEIGTTIQVETMPLVGFVTTSGGTLTIYCLDSSSTADAVDITLGALKVGSATGDVAGG